jgi:hypothetical protein
MMAFADRSNKRWERYKLASYSRPPSAAAPCFFLAAGEQGVVCAWRERACERSEIVYWARYCVEGRGSTVAQHSSL